MGFDPRVSTNLKLSESVVPCDAGVGEVADRNKGNTEAAPGKLLQQR